MMITWDGNQKKYRVWYFATSPPWPELEGVITFESNNEWYAQWQNVPQPGGKRVTHLTRFRLKSPDELDIITETLHPDGKKEHLGVVTCRRKK
jgi:hypothetical protein